MNVRHPSIERKGTYQSEHDRSAKGADRVNNRPRTLRALHAWAVNGYQLEAPGRLHDRDVADDGSPDHTGEFNAYVGFSQGDTPNDWRKVACRVDRETGYFLTPMRAAISRVGDPDYRQLLGGLACNLLTPMDVTRSMGVPDWAASAVMYRALDLLWSVYRDKPLPQATRKSDAQLDAEAAAA